MAIQGVSGVASSGLAMLADAAATQARPRPESQSAAAPVPVARDAVQATGGVARSQDVRHAVETVNQVVQARVSSLEFSIEPDTQMRVVKLVDSETKEVLRQVPSDEVLAIAKAIDRLKGLLLREDA